MLWSYISAREENGAKGDTTMESWFHRKTRFEQQKDLIQFPHFQTENQLNYRSEAMTAVAPFRRGLKLQ